MQERTKVVKIGKQDVICNYPNVGQKIRIENLRMLLTKNMYGDLSRSNHFSGNELLDVVDAFSTIMVCCPVLNLTEDKFEVLDDLTSKYLREAYLTEIYPWLESVKKELNSVDLSTNKENEQ